ncbi:MAG: hypothetical protein F4217_04605 [Acidimicrobiaceae bacterium]|nr:hypothetical protein [Acidimicrobiaceae bacterium]
MHDLVKFALAVFVVIAAAGCSSSESSESAIAAPTTTISIPETTTPTTAVLDVPTTSTSTTTPAEAPTSTTTVPEFPTSTPDVVESMEITPEPPLLCFLENMARKQDASPVIRVNYAEWENDRGDMEATIQWDAQCADDSRAMWSTGGDWHLMSECSDEGPFGPIESRRWRCASAKSDAGIPTKIRISAINDNAQTVVSFTIFDSTASTPMTTSTPTKTPQGEP